MTEIKQNRKKMTRGGQNLVILGVTSTVLAILTTGISLAIYHNSGDIYLDRSRPGFLPDEEEVEEENEKEEEYSCEKSGSLTIGSIEEYLEELKSKIKEVDSYENPFDSEVLSDERFGISEMNSDE